jgi:hypothetical protein
LASFVSHIDCNGGYQKMHVKAQFEMHHESWHRRLLVATTIQIPLDTTWIDYIWMLFLIIGVYNAMPIGCVAHRVHALLTNDFRIMSVHLHYNVLLTTHGLFIRN